MAWTIKPSELCEGGTLVTTSVGDLDKLPERYAAALTPEHRVAMANPTAYFKGLAAKCSIPGLKGYLDWLAQAHGWELHLTSGAFGCHVQTDAGICPVWRDRYCNTKVRLRNPEDDNQVPPALQGVFQLIRGTYYAPFEAGGIELRRRKLAHDYELLPPVLVRDPSSVDCFYNMDGDLLIADGDRAIWFLHESNGFVDYGLVQDVLNRYFRSCVDGSQWELGDPYEMWRQQNPGRDD